LLGEQSESDVTAESPSSLPEQEAPRTLTRREVLAGEKRERRRLRRGGGSYAPRATERTRRNGRPRNIERLYMIAEAQRLIKVAYTGRVTKKEVDARQEDQPEARAEG
jgi:hypothetical protein